MDRDKTLALAREAGFRSNSNGYACTENYDGECQEELFRFAALVEEEVRKGSDLERLESLLTDFGVPFEKDDKTPVYGTSEKVDGTVIRCKVNEGPVSGYSFFFTEFLFDPDGKFKHMGIWE